MTMSKLDEKDISNRRMWETLDFRDRALVRFAQRDLQREVARDRLARQARVGRPSIFAPLAARLALRRTPAGIAS